MQKAHNTDPIRTETALVFPKNGFSPRGKAWLLAASSINLEPGGEKRRRNIDFYIAKMSPKTRKVVVLCGGTLSSVSFLLHIAADFWKSHYKNDSTPSK